MSKAHNLAWAAGFFDGDGYCTVQVRGGKYKGHYIVAGVNHVAEAPIHELIRLFGGKFRRQRIEKVVGNRKRRIEWKLTCSNAESFLKQIQPYLVNKKEVVKKLLELQATMGTTTKVSVETFNLRTQLKNEVQIINAKD